MKTSTCISSTSKGHRVFLEGIGRVGKRYNVTFCDLDHPNGGSIVITFTPEGKRAVVARGVIDLQSKKVSAWAQDSTEASIEYVTDDFIIVRRVL